MTQPGGATRETAVQAVVGATLSTYDDRLAVEEPLELRVRTLVAGQSSERVVSVTMRTPAGDDADLGVGYLYTEGLVRSPQQVAAVHQPDPNVIVVELIPELALDLGSVERHFYTTSACGVCGKSSLAAIRTSAHEPLRPGPRVGAALIHTLPETLRSAQPTFGRTGGLHAAGLFDRHGRLFAAREDVGRHNAVDKLLGAELRAGRLPAHDCLLCVSGRASFELVQKARMASLPIFVAVGAPSSLAVELARECGMTLIGFARDQRFNIYTGPERIAESTPAEPPAPPLVHIRKAAERP
jgi:FdhD protein